MSLTAYTKTLADMRARVRRMCDIGGTSGVARHPDADIDDEINSGYAALQRRLSALIPDQRFLASASITTADGTSVYEAAGGYPADLQHLLSVDIVAEGRKRWLLAFEEYERSSLTDPSLSYRGVPLAYRLHPASIELLPAPAGVYTVTVRYVPHITELSGSDKMDTVARFDDFVVMWAAKTFAKKDRAWDLHTTLNGDIVALEGEILTFARNRDMNSPPRMVDVSHADRYGRRFGMGRYR